MSDRFDRFTLSLLAAHLVAKVYSGSVTREEIEEALRRALNGLLEGERAQPARLSDWVRAVEGSRAAVGRELRWFDDGSDGVLDLALDLYVPGLADRVVIYLGPATPPYIERDGKVWLRPVSPEDLRAELDELAKDEPPAEPVVPPVRKGELLEPCSCGLYPEMSLLPREKGSRWQAVVYHAQCGEYGPESVGDTREEAVREAVRRWSRGERA